jgi:6,7-dimethyl-8-ribityllumazine synthase
VKKSYDTTRTEKIAGARIAIVQASWHKELTDRMVDATNRILTDAEVSDVEVFVVPGCYEIPLTAKKLAKSGKYDAIVVYGIIVKGDTDHYDVILQTCIRELGRVMYEFETPIIMEILPVHDIAHAIARTEGEHNKGIEAAQAAIKLIALYREMEN